MREILFRGKRVDTGEWVHGDLIHHDGYVAIWDKNASYVEDFEVIPESVGQYTGLTDENGKKIFEGDIVTFKTFTQKLKAEVIYKGGEYWCKSKCGKELLSIVVENCKKDCELHCEIIGNIHDNPELLEVKL